MKVPRRMLLAAMLGWALPGFPGDHQAPVVSATGYGRIHFGERLSTVETRLKQRGSGPVLNPDCYYVSFPAYPGAQFMVEGDIITRVDFDALVDNEAGIQAGTTIEEVKRRYPAATLTPNDYSPDAPDIMLTTPGGDAALLFNTDGKVVVLVRAGLVPSVTYGEGCS